MFHMVVHLSLKKGEKLVLIFLSFVAAILVIYLTRWLKFEKDRATSIFHGFSLMCYLMPVFGAVLADGFLGRFK